MMNAAALNAARADFEELSVVAAMEVSTPGWDIMRTVTGKQAPIYFRNTTGFGYANILEDGEQAAEDEFANLPQLTITPKMRGKSYKWTRLGMHQDQYNLVEESARDAGRKLQMTKERDAIDAIFNDAFTSTTFCATGDAFFSDSHTINGLNFDNLYAASALSPATLQGALTQLRRQTDARNIIMPATGNYKLLVSPENEFTALTIQQSVQVAGTADNDKNVIASRFQVVVTDYADANSTAWALFPVNARDHFIRKYIHLADETGMEKVAEGHARFVHQCAYGLGADLPYGCVGSLGA